MATRRKAWKEWEMTTQKTAIRLREMLIEQYLGMMVSTDDACVTDAFENRIIRLTEEISDIRAEMEGGG